jgi:hypothetical protein
MGTQRNWNFQIGPAVPHITDTQLGGALPMRELDPGFIRTPSINMPRGRGITGQPGGYAPGTNPLIIGKPLITGDWMRKRANASRNNSQFGGQVSGQAPNEPPPMDTSVYSHQAPGDEPGGLVGAARPAGPAPRSPGPVSRLGGALASRAADAVGRRLAARGLIDYESPGAASAPMADELPDWDFTERPAARQAAPLTYRRTS